MRFENEPVRHKALDLIGDLALLGMPLQGHVIASKVGMLQMLSWLNESKKFMKRKYFASGFRKVFHQIICLILIQF